MKTIVLISCASKKLPHKVKAKDLYTSPLFKYNLEYAKSLNPDKIFILSAKHGLINLNQEIEPYNQTLNKMNKKEIQLWAEKVINQLKNASDLKFDKIIFLAGKRYREHLIPNIVNYEVPLEGLGIGKQLGFLKSKFKGSKKCQTIHQIFNNLKRINYPFNGNDIPLNGIYVLFEKGERKGNFDRIVRIGTHTGQDQLRSRLKQHFINENKDRSIFRKNIGRAILNKRRDPYLKIWEIDLTTRDTKEKFGSLINEEKQKQIEKEISKFIQDNFSFVIIPIKDKDDRLNMESKIIATISLCPKCNPSSTWLGLFSPKQKIRESGLWLVNELYKEPLSEENIEKLKNLIRE